MKKRIKVYKLESSSNRKKHHLIKKNVVSKKLAINNFFLNPVIHELSSKQ